MRKIIGLNISRGSTDTGGYYANSKRKRSKTVPQSNGRQNKIRELLGQHKPEEVLGQATTLDVSALEKARDKAGLHSMYDYCMVPEQIALNMDNPLVQILVEFMGGREARMCKLLDTPKPECPNPKCPDPEYTDEDVLRDYLSRLGGNEDE